MPMEIKKKYPLINNNTLAIDSTAEYFAQPENESEVQACLHYASEHNLAVKVLGGGSNVVMSDCIEGLVLKYIGQKCEVLCEDQNGVTVRVDAGYNWHEFVMFCLSKGWYGLENLAYIPGCVGAAPVQNIGAYGVEVKRCICSVSGVYLHDGNKFRFSNEQCVFDYRESCFKQALNGQTLITYVEFELTKVASVQVEYSPLNLMAKERGVPTPQELAQWVIEVRQSKLPDPNVLPNAGSFFKNPVVPEDKFEKLLSRFPELPGYPQKKGVKLAAGWLIDRLGFKGKEFGPVSVHEMQALVLVNKGGSGRDVLNAAEQVCDAVYERYGVRLEQEPRLFA